MSGGHQ